MGRLILGIVVGLIVAMGTVWLVDLAGHQVYPVPTDAMNSYEAIGRYISSMPAGALAIVAGAWFFGALVGGVVAGTISRREWTIWAIAALVAVAGVLNIVMIPHPVVLQIAAVVAPILGALVAKAIVRRRGAGGAV
jgi:F420-0:gamma-glutamyl ligase-like protein